jgi:ABC-type uncharacterized transport system ATPase subunit
MEPPRGVSIIFITHKLKEVRVADQITVMRNGRVGTTTPEETNGRLASMMVAEVILTVKKERRNQKKRSRSRDLHVKDDRD